MSALGGFDSWNDPFCQIESILVISSLLHISLDYYSFHQHRSAGSFRDCNVMMLSGFVGLGDGLRKLRGFNGQRVRDTLSIIEKGCDVCGHVRRVTVRDAS